MSLSEKNEKKEVMPMKEHRTRKITLEPWVYRNERELLNEVVHFDNFALTIMNDAKVAYQGSIIMKVRSGQCNPPFYLNRFSEPWKVEAKVVFRLAENETEVLEQFNLSLSNKDPSFLFPGLYNLFFSKPAVMEVKLTTLDGLNVEPLRNYAVTNKYSDVTIIVEGQRFELNKTFLASHSSYFETLFFGGFDEKNKKEIELEEVSAEAFTDLLDILTLSMHQLHRKDALFAVLKLADQQDVPLVVKRIENMLMMYPDMRVLNIAEKLWAADKYNMNMVLMHVISTWTVDDTETYMNDELWNDLKSATTLQLLKTLGNQIKETSPL